MSPRGAERARKRRRIEPQVEIIEISSGDESDAVADEDDDVQLTEPPPDHQPLLATPITARKLRECNLLDGRQLKVLQTGIDPPVLQYDPSIEGVWSQYLQGGRGESDETQVVRHPTTDVQKAGRVYVMQARIYQAVDLAAPGQFWSVRSEVAGSAEPDDIFDERERSNETWFARLMYIYEDRGAPFAHVRWYQLASKGAFARRMDPTRGRSSMRGAPVHAAELEALEMCDTISLDSLLARLDVQYVDGSEPTDLPPAMYFTRFTAVRRVVSPKPR